MGENDEFKYHLLSQSAEEPGQEKEDNSNTARKSRPVKSRSLRTHILRKMFYLHSSWWVFLLLVASVLFNAHLLLSPKCIPNEITIKYVPTSSTPNHWIEANKSSQTASPQNVNLSSLLPRTISYNDSEILAMVEDRSHMAARYFDRWSRKDFGKDAVKHSTVTYCDRVQMISPHLLHQNNLYWQVVDASFGGSPMTIYLYNAYYDDRIWGKPAVRLITVTERQADVEKVKFGCLLWFDKLRSPVLSKVSEVYSIWPDSMMEANTYGPQIMTCDIPKEYSTQLPQAVSLQTMSSCDKMATEPTNIVRVIKQPRESQFHPKRSIGICVQAFRFGAYDLSVRLVEWLELVRMLGADKVYFYVYGATDNMRKVMRHYQKEGLVDWREIALPGQQVNIESMFNYFYLRMHSKFWPQELIELNDCLYRNLYRHEYLGIFDIDEIIMPQKLDNWHQLLEKVENGLSEYDLAHTGYYSNRNAYVYESFEERQIPPSTVIPEYLYMMRHTYRDNLKYPGQIAKSFQRTALTFAAHNHFAMRCLNTTEHEKCPWLTIDPDDSFLMHYRVGVKPKCPKPSCAIQDRTGWRYYDRLKERVERQLWQLFGSTANRTD